MRGRPRLFALPLLCAALLASSGCSFGFGSSYVGQWREREEIDYEVCVEDQAGNCAARRTITTVRPARRYWGIHLLYPAFGISQSALGDETETGARFELGFEYLRGRGNRAFGLRLSEIWDATGDYWYTAPMVTAVGHLGLSDRFSAYGGLGAAPYNRLSVTLPGKSDPEVEQSHLSGRALGGLQMVIGGSQETRLLFSVEADTVMTRFDGAAFRASSLTFQLGMSI